MEYATQICDDICDNNYIKYVGYSQAYSGIEKYYSKNTIKKISCKITELLQGVDKYNRPIIVPDKTICSVMSDVEDANRPQTGDIFSRYNIPSQGNTGSVNYLIDKVINIITTDVKNNLGIEQNNEKLSIWTTVLGDFNKHGLRQHPPIKLREKRPTPMLFNMNY